MSKIKIFSLGGLNENGKNMYVVQVDQSIFIFDAGLKHADEKMLGIDYAIPNNEFIKNNVDNIVGIFLTHGHETNMGAVTDILKVLPSIKIYGSKFTLEMVRLDLREQGMSESNLVEIVAHRKIEFGENSIFPISVTHSVPDALAYVLNTKDGAIFYTGHYTFDSLMTGFYKTDIGKLAYVGKQGVLCLLSESTYADREGHTSPNHRILTLIKEILNHYENRIFFTVFTAHIYRIQELFNAVMATDRKLVIMGKKLQNMIMDIINMGYLTFDVSRIGTLEDLNEPNTVVLISNENEKPFFNLERIVNGYDKNVKVLETDTFVFLEPTADGMEKKAVKIEDEISKIGAKIITLSPKKHLLYHASSEDLMLMLNLLNPKYYFPVSGEYRHQVANAKIASRLGMPRDNILLKQNGDVILIENGELQKSVERIRTEEILIDGNTVQDIGDMVLKDREMLSDNGIVIICATLDRRSKDILAGPEVLTRGFIYVKESAEIINDAAQISLKVIQNNITSNYIDYSKVKNGIREELGKYLFEATECKPMIITVITEV